MKLSYRDKYQNEIIKISQLVKEYEAPSFNPEGENLYEHETPTEVIKEQNQMHSPYKNTNIIKLKYLNNYHQKLLDEMFQELGDKFKDKEISERFWDVIPADVRSRYKDKVNSVRTKIRNIYQQYPQHFEEYKQKNKPYFKKQERNNLEIKGL